MTRIKIAAPIKTANFVVNILVHLLFSVMSASEASISVTVVLVIAEGTQYKSQTS